MDTRATITDSKEIFHKEFPYVIPPIYRKVADELLVELHLLTHQRDFKINRLFAVGLIELFKTFTRGYKPDNHLPKLFSAICNCNGVNPNEIEEESDQLLKSTLNIGTESLPKVIEEIFDKNENKIFYSRIQSIGLYTIIKNASKKELTYEDNLKRTTALAEIIGLEKSRLEKDVSLYKANMEKMKQALEIMSENIGTKKTKSAG